MRPNFIKTSLALFLCSPFAASASLAADWNGSYSANEQCFCVGAVASTIRDTIVPTPIGGQTIAQVCLRVGDGPGLTLSEGVYNHPVFSDSQCGNGPFDIERAVVESTCAGSLDGKGAESASCQPIGPQWNVRQAYSKNKVGETKKISTQKPKVKALVKKDVVAKKEIVASVKPKPIATTISIDKPKPKPSVGLIDRPVVTSTTITRADKEKGTTRTLKATVISSASTAGRELPKRKPLPSFTGKVINISGKRYMQARKGLLAKGGELGSKIIIDGLVFLLDDGSIKATDLYRTPTTTVKKSKKKSSSKKSNQSAKQRVAAITQTEPDISQANKVTDNAGMLPRLPIPSGASQQSDAETSQPTYELETATESIEPQVSSVSEEIGTTENNNPLSQVGILSALKLPASAIRKDRRFSYLEAVPVSFDVGGAGIMVKGSSESHSQFHYVGRIGVADTYREAMLGGGYYLTPGNADRLTVVLQAGVEYGSFSLDDDQNPAISVDYSDSGLYFGAATRLVLDHRFELRGGLGYSTFFKGDMLMFGGAYWHMTPQLDLVSQFELGDNDLVGLGIRYYY